MSNSNAYINEYVCICTYVHIKNSLTKRNDKHYSQTICFRNIKIWNQPDNSNLSNNQPQQQWKSMAIFRVYLINKLIVTIFNWFDLKLSHSTVKRSTTTFFQLFQFPADSFNVCFHSPFNPLECCFWFDFDSLRTQPFGPNTNVGIWYSAGSGLPRGRLINTQQSVLSNEVAKCEFLISECWGISIL